MVAFNKNRTYQPTLRDIAWAETVVSLLKDGGIWGCPMNQSEWKIDKKNKELCLIHGPMDDVFIKCKSVFAKIDYKILDKRK